MPPPSFLSSNGDADGQRVPERRVLRPGVGHREGVGPHTSRLTGASSLGPGQKQTTRHGTPGRPRRIPTAHLPPPTVPDAPSPLTSKQRTHLRGLAHPLKPLLHVGKEGVTVPTIRAVREAFNTRELLKVKVLESAPAPARDVGAALVAEVEDAAVVQVVGRTLTLYRPHPDAPVIRLPR